MKAYNLGTFENDTVIEIGLEIESLIIKVNCTTQDFIMVFCVSVIANVIVICFQIVASLGLNDELTGCIKISIVAALSFAVFMYLVRFYNLMKSGQRLAINVKQSRRALEDVMINQIKLRGLSEKAIDKLSVLHGRLEVYQYQHPISPYSIFGLSNRTFCGTLATIITYIVVLVKVRGVETSNTLSNSNTINQTITT